MKPINLLFSLALGICSLSKAQGISATAVTTLPGRGLAEHDFFYAGESKDRKMFIVRKGAVVWSYDDPAVRGEISDAVLLSTGNVLLAHQFAVKMITPEKKIIWHYDVPQGCEVHTAMPIGQKHVLFVQNGASPIARVVDIVTGETKIEFPLPVGNPKGVHGQFRHARITAAGTLLVAHMDFGKVCEYDSKGKELWSFPAATPWSAEPIKNGNILITDRLGIREVTRRGDVVWDYAKTASTDYKLLNLQLAWRLPNGNTLINNWANQWSGQVDATVPTVQAIEVTSDKRVVWALRSWAEPDLGPATTIQILEPLAPENVTFGEIGKKD